MTRALTLLVLTLFLSPDVVRAQEASALRLALASASELSLNVASAEQGAAEPDLSLPDGYQRELLVAERSDLERKYKSIGLTGPRVGVGISVSVLFLSLITPAAIAAGASAATTGCCGSGGFLTAKGNAVPKARFDNPAERGAVAAITTGIALGLAGTIWSAIRLRRKKKERHRLRRRMTEIDAALRPTGQYVE